MFGIETEINFILCSFMWLDWELGIKIHCYENQILLSLGLWFLSSTWHYESPPFPFLFTLAKRSTNVLCISLSYTIMFIHTKYQPKLEIRNLRLKLLITFILFFFLPLSRKPNRTWTKRQSDQGKKNQIQSQTSQNANQNPEPYPENLKHDELSKIRSENPIENPRATRTTLEIHRSVIFTSEIATKRK